MADEFTGGCLCGAVRFVVTGPPRFVAYCHCGICRRASGAPASAWAMFQDTGFRFTAGTPTRFASSDHGQRTFCASCGSPLVFTSTQLPGMVDVTIGSFDDPAALPPAFHIFESRRLPWHRTADDLPRYAELPE